MYQVGNKVRYANPDSGYEGDRKLAAKFLVANRVYTVTAVSIGAFDGRIQLLEVVPSGIWFNHIHFELAASTLMS